MKPQMNTDEHASARPALTPAKASPKVPAGIRHSVGVIMRKIVLLASCSWLAVAAALSTPAAGAEPVPDGGKITVKVTVTATSKGKSDIRTSAIDHSFTGSCVLKAAG